MVKAFLFCICFYSNYIIEITVISYILKYILKPTIQPEHSPISTQEKQLALEIFQGACLLHYKSKVYPVTAESIVVLLVLLLRYS